jgi:hypothetical protein
MSPRLPSGVGTNVSPTLRAFAARGRGPFAFLSANNTDAWAFPNGTPVVPTLGLAFTPSGLSATGGLHFTAPNGEAVVAAGLGSLVASGSFAGSGPYTASAVTFSGTNVIGKTADTIVALLGPSGPTMLAALSSLGTSGLADVLAGLTIPQGYSVQSFGEPKRFATAGEAESAGKCGPSDVVFVMPGNRYGTKAAKADRLGSACKATLPKNWTSA